MQIIVTVGYYLFTVLFFNSTALDPCSVCDLMTPSSQIEPCMFTILHVLAKSEFLEILNFIVLSIVNFFMETQRRIDGS